MAKPTTRAEFKEYVLRRLGKPVIEINVSDDQVEDRIDEALRYYADYHFDGTEKVYYKHQITEQDKINKYITVPENIIGAVRFFDIGMMVSGGSNMFSLQYQIALNDLYTLTSQSLIPYWMAIEQIQFMEQILVGQQPIRFNRHTNKIYFDIDWNRFKAGQYLIVEAYQVVDPDQYVDVWNDRWLQRYTAALVKRQWGANLSKFDGVQLPGGVTFNGSKIYDDGDAEVTALENEMITSYSLPVHDMIG